MAAMSASTCCAGRDDCSGSFVLDDDLSTDAQIYRLLATKESVSRQALNATLASGITKSA
jgi:hypothetical protein